MRLISDNTKARKLTGWRPMVDLDIGLAKVIEYIKANRNLYKTQLYNV